MRSSLTAAQYQRPLTFRNIWSYISTLKLIVFEQEGLSRKESVPRTRLGGNSISNVGRQAHHLRLSWRVRVESEDDGERLLSCLLVVTKINKKESTQFHFSSRHSKSWTVVENDAVIIVIIHNGEGNAKGHADGWRSPHFLVYRYQSRNTVSFVSYVLQHAAGT